MALMVLQNKLERFSQKINFILVQGFLNEAGAYRSGVHNYTSSQIVFILKNALAYSA
jgi:hypothetical protein